MSGLNKVILIGNLGADPEMRFSPEGKAVTNFSLAVTTGKDKSAKTTWFRVSCWQRLAELVNQYLTKGRQVYVEGRLYPREWQGNDGKSHTSLDVVADRVVFLGARPEVAEATGEEPEVFETPPETEPEDTPF